jgi:hypothetical protein
MSTENQTAPEVPAVTLNGKRFELEPITIPERKTRTGVNPATVYMRPALNAVTAVAFVTSLFAEAEKVKADSSVELAHSLLKDSYRQATVDATDDEGDFAPPKWSISIATTDRPRAHGEKLADMQAAASELANELLFLWEVDSKYQNDPAGIAAATQGEYKTRTALTQARVAKTEKRKNILKAIAAKEAASEERKKKIQEKKAQEAKAPAGAFATEPAVLH